MKIAQIEDSLKTITKNLNKETFIYEFLLAYGLPKASITRLKKGNLNLSKTESEVSWKNKLFFREEYKEDLHICVTELAVNIKQNQRFVKKVMMKKLHQLDLEATKQLIKKKLKAYFMISPLIQLLSLTLLKRFLPMRKFLFQSKV